MDWLHAMSTFKSLTMCTSSHFAIVGKLDHPTLAYWPVLPVVYQNGVKGPQHTYSRVY